MPNLSLMIECKLAGIPSSVDRRSGFPIENEHISDYLAGALLGTAIGDALGLFTEGMSGRTIEALFKSGITRYHLIGDIGFVSDDTEQSALIAQALVKHSDDKLKCSRAFQKSMVGWFLRMPFGVGRATSFSCLRMMTGSKNTGINSAGNGAAMRAAVVGVFFYDDKENRIKFGTSLATVTHTDRRAIDGALFAAEVAAEAFANRQNLDDEVRYRCFDEAIKVVSEKSLHEALVLARSLSTQNASIEQATARLGNSGFVNHTIPFSMFVFLRFGSDCLTAIQSAIKGGGDTDTNAAIVGAWCGALYGERGLPHALINQINDGPFGPSHLRALAKALESVKLGQHVKVPEYSCVVALARNLGLYPIILSHAFVRLVRGRISSRG
jgi:ADP-ribosyl-[dinitrogen reductase] hydrolase